MITRRSAAAHVFVADVAAPILSDEDRHHLGRVLRLRSGEIIGVSDGSGTWRPFSFHGSDADLVPVGDPVTVVRPQPEFAVAFAVIKGERPELVVQKLTELGIDHIIPVITERTVVRWDAGKIERNHERLLKVQREAAMQSRAVYMPKLHRSVVGLENLLGFMVELGLDAGLALADPVGEPFTNSISAIIIGPEGGFTAEECATITRHVALPGGILRAETAAIAAGVLLANQRPKIADQQP